jgi:phosphatidylserine/phosphatidylglycerophosphate/cardiolipin synthase-like enzyme
VPAPKSTTTSSVTEPTTSTTTTAPPPVLSLTVEPADQYRSVDQLIEGARHGLDMTMYELADPKVESLLAGARQRGVAIRILLDRAGSGASVNQAAFDALQSRKIPVRWAPTSVDFHQKTVTADQAVSAIMTGNLTSNDYATTRDFVVLDRNATAVRSIESVFDRDWRAAPTTRVRSADGLVWSPGARTTLAGFIAAARHTLTVENEEMDSPAIVSALKAAGRRGVVVHVTMTANPMWTAVWTGLTRNRVEVATYPATATALYIHAKAMVADDTTAFVGSQNFSSDGLAHNRELGLITSDPGVVGPLAQTMAADFAGGTRFRGGAGGTTATTKGA